MSIEVMIMKRVLVLTLVLMMVLTCGAFAFDPARFEGVEGVKVEYDVGNPSAYSVTAGFAQQTQAGGQVLVRYKNMGASEEIPMMLVMFTTDGVKAANMSVRTDAHRYSVVCTDLTRANMTALDTEGAVLVMGASVDMLRDMVSSAYTGIELWNDDPADAFKFMLSDADRELIALFVEEYDAQIAPMVVAGSSVEKVFNALSAVVTAESAEDVSAAIAEIQASAYEPLEQGTSSEAVQALQQNLIDLGYLSGSADGIFGKNTAKAVRAFQTACGQEATGVADEAMQRQLAIAMLVAE